MSDEKVKDPFFEARVERAVKAFRGRVAPEDLAALEATVRDTLENDPVAMELLNAARPRVVPLHSEATNTPGAASADNQGAEPTAAGRGKE